MMPTLNLVTTDEYIHTRLEMHILCVLCKLTIDRATPAKHIENKLLATVYYYNNVKTIISKITCNKTQRNDGI